MTKDDWKVFCNVLNAVSLITVGKEQTPEALLLMFETLKHYELSDVQKAISEHLRTKDGKFFPTPSHLIQILDGNEDESAEVAWRLFLKAVRRYGNYETVKFPAPAFHYAIEQLGGWVKVNSDINELTEKELAFYSKDFKMLFNVGKRKCNWEDVPLALAGEIEQNNSFNGLMDYLPEIIEVSTGKQIKRKELFLEANTEVKEVVKKLAQGRRREWDTLTSRLIT